MKITLTYEQDYQYNEIDKSHFPEKKVIHEINPDGLPWETLVKEYLEFLNCCGYIINPVMHDDLVADMAESHYEHVVGKIKSRGV